MNKKVAKDTGKNVSREFLARGSADRKEKGSRSTENARHGVPHANCIQRQVAQDTRESTVSIGIRVSQETGTKTVLQRNRDCQTRTVYE